MPHAPDLSGRALNDRYELHAGIGEGAFGRVYRGWDRRLEREVAVKVIKPWWSEDPAWARSFEREARLLARINHPGIVQIFDVGQASEGLYYVSELVDGESLADVLARGELEAPTATALAEQLCRALAQAHAKRVIHRDVKPANILISTAGVVKVGDFGVARLAEGSSDGGSATIVGTPRYMAPEQARGVTTTPATDVYSAGIVLYEMLAGRPPFTDVSAVELALRHLRDAPPPLPRATPAPLVEIVARALAKDSGHRYADAGAMADALSLVAVDSPAPARRARERVAVGGGGEGASRPPRPAPPRPGRPHHEATRQAPKLTPRRNVNPSARRRSIAALTLAFVLLGAMITAALVLGATAHVRVPRLIGMTRDQVRARAGRSNLQTSFSTRYDRARTGTAIAQNPGAHVQVRQGSTVRVVLSAGPPPEPVPQLAGDQLSVARAKLASLGLAVRATIGPAPGVPAGTVTSQSPAPWTKLAPPKSVTLYVAESPQWRALTALTGDGQTTTAEVRVRGTQWRIVYVMAYQGTCTFVIFCSSPHVAAANVDSGASVGSFGLTDSGRQTHIFSTGPGLFRLSVSPGADSAGWQVWVQDWY